MLLYWLIVSLLLVGHSSTERYYDYETEHYDSAELKIFEDVTEVEDVYEDDDEDDNETEEPIIISLDSTVHTSTTTSSTTTYVTPTRSGASTTSPTSTPKTTSTPSPTPEISSTPTSTLKTTSTPSPTSETDSPPSPTTETSSPSSPTTETSSPSSPTIETSSPPHSTPETSSPPCSTPEPSLPPSSTAKTSSPPSPTTETSSPSSPTTETSSPPSPTETSSPPCSTSETSSTTTADLTPSTNTDPTELSIFGDLPRVPPIPQVPTDPAKWPPSPDTLFVEAGMQIDPLRLTHFATVQNDPFITNEVTPQIIYRPFVQFQQVVPLPYQYVYRLPAQYPYQQDPIINLFSPPLPPRSPLFPSFRQSPGYLTPNPDQLSPFDDSISKRMAKTLAKNEEFLDIFAHILSKQQPDLVNMVDPTSSENPDAITAALLEAFKNDENFNRILSNAYAEARGLTGPSYESVLKFVQTLVNNKEYEMELASNFEVNAAAQWNDRLENSQDRLTLRARG